MGLSQNIKGTNKIQICISLDPAKFSCFTIRLSVTLLNKMLPFKNFFHNLTTNIQQVDYKYATLDLPNSSHISDVYFENKE